MPLGNSPSFSQVKAFFNGPDSLSQYVRGGLYVPDIPANSAISATIAGLRLSQFSGADKVALPPAPTLTNAGASDSVQSSNGYAQAYASIEIRPDGFVWTNTENSGSVSLYQWLPIGHSASEYDYRTSVDQINWSGWVTLSGLVSVAFAQAITDGFYSDSQQTIVYVQMGAQGTTLTGTVVFDCQATATGRD